MSLLYVLFVCWFHSQGINYAKDYFNAKQITGDSKSFHSPVRELKSKSQLIQGRHRISKAKKSSVETKQPIVAKAAKTSPPSSQQAPSAKAAKATMRPTTSSVPSKNPSEKPSRNPSEIPSQQPSYYPTESKQPSDVPTTYFPTVSNYPSKNPN
jgi:hypothetical protein